MDFVKRIFSVRTLSRIALYLWCAFSVFTFGWVIVSSLKANNEFFRNVWGLPAAPQFQNYVKVLTNYNLGTNFLNSLIVVISAVAVLLVICAPAAYVLSRFKFLGVTAIGRGFMLGMGVPYQLLLVPLYFMMVPLKLLNTHFGLVLLYIALSIPFTIFMMQGFFKTLPHQLEEAAMIDGCTPIETFFRIMLPLGNPALITAGIFNFIFLWNEFLLALTFVSDSEKFTLSVGLYGLQGSMQYTGDWVSLFAGFVVVAVPTLVVYMLMSRRVIDGLTMGAVKE
jgi:raffinose/stachyose/melibiose transport system permease protein/N-acetylglucosamine transport system permease protein